MAHGGGTFLTQNKVLAGAYINIISLAGANTSLSERGIATIALPLDWGEKEKVVMVTKEDFQKNSLKIFGYDYTHEKLKGLRDLFRNIHTLYVFRLNGGGVKASNTHATAKFAGTRGNGIKTVISANVDEPSKFNVKTLVDNTLVDDQVVATSADLKDNDFVEFKKNSSLQVTAGIPCMGGTNSEVTGAEHQKYLNQIEKYTFNTMGLVMTDEVTKGLYINFNKRLRDEVGKKFQLVVYNKAADYEGVINVKNSAEGDEAAMVYWVTGVISGTPVNKSALNKIYDGEYKPNVDHSQSELEKAIKKGEFMFHKVNDEVRVLMDINSLVTTTDEKGEIFKDNQTVRVADQIANDIAVLFNTHYLGIIPNDEAGRISLWNDVCKIYQKLESIRAIEGFKTENVTIERGETKRSVVCNTKDLNIINAMGQLYMTVVIV